jgi:hypothetical protein
MGIRPIAAIVTAAALCAATAGLFAASQGAADTTPPRAAWGLTNGKLGSAVAVPSVKGAARLTTYASGFTTTSIDNGPSGASPGDEIIGFGLLKTAGGTSAGELDIHETLTNLQNPDALRIMIDATARLRLGSLSLSGMQLSNQQGTRLAVTGGTGRYWNVRGGQVTASGASNGRVKLTFLLIRQ